MKNLISKLKSRKGFTLVEMIVVMAIIGILVALLAPNVATLIKDAQDTSNDAKAKNVMTTLAAYNTKHVKDGYYFDTTKAGTAKNLDNNAAVKEYVLKVTASDFSTKIPELWATKDTTSSAVTHSKISYIGGSDAYLPENVLSGNDVMYLYLSSEGSVIGVAYVNEGDNKVKSVAGGLQIGGTSEITATGGTGTISWNNVSLRGATTTDGTTFTVPTVTST